MAYLYPFQNQHFLKYHPMAIPLDQVKAQTHKLL